MADIELVIKIPEGLKNDFESEQWTALSCMEMKNALEKATPLPEGHGDLITKEQAIELVEFYQLNPQHFDFGNLMDEIKNEKPIIPAENDGEE